MIDDQKEAFYPMQKAINTSLQQDCNTLRVRLDGVRARLDYLEARLEAVDLRLSSCMAPSLDMTVKTTPLPPHSNQFASPAMTELRAASEIFPVEYADSNGDGIRIIMEPADETGRVCWVVRNSRRVNPIHEFPTPEAAYAAHQAMPAVKDSLTDGGSLVERVAYAMGPQSQAAMDAGELPHGAARAAIREVAAWLRDNDRADLAGWLEQEADHG
jgi:hypothetical protein